MKILLLILLLPLSAFSQGAGDWNGCDLMIRLDDRIPQAEYNDTLVAGDPMELRGQICLVRPLKSPMGNANTFKDGWLAISVGKIEGQELVGDTTITRAMRVWAENKTVPPEMLDSLRALVLGGQLTMYGRDDLPVGPGTYGDGCRIVISAHQIIPHIQTLRLKE